MDSACTETSPSVFLKITNVKIHVLFTGPECGLGHLFYDCSSSGLKLIPTTQTNIAATAVSGSCIVELETNGVALENEFHSGSETTGRTSIPLTGASSGTYSLR
jgi:hypothetical protein